MSYFHKSEDLVTVMSTRADICGQAEHRKWDSATPSSGSTQGQGPPGGGGVGRTRQGQEQTELSGAAQGEAAWVGSGAAEGCGGAWAGQQQ